MKNPLRKRSEAERLEADLAAKQQARSKLIDRLAAAEAEGAKVRATIPELAGLDDDRSLGGAEREIRASEDRCRSLQAGITKSDNEISECERALSAERDRIARTQSIATLTKLTTDLSAPLDRLTDALHDLDLAFRAAGDRHLLVRGMGASNYLSATEAELDRLVRSARDSLAYLARRIESGEAPAALAEPPVKVAPTAPVPRPAPPPPGKVYDPLAVRYVAPPGIDGARN